MRSKKVEVPVLPLGVVGLALLVGSLPSVSEIQRGGVVPPACRLVGGADQGGKPVAIPFATRPAGPATIPQTQGNSSVLQTLVDIPLPGRPVRFDYQTEDQSSGLLYISHMNDAHVVVFDTRDRRVVGRVGETPGVTGIWVVPELRKLYASVTGRRYVAVIDTDSLTVPATLGPIGFPDGIGYAPEAKRIFVSDESGGEELVIDGPTDKIVTRIPIGGEAGNTKYDSGSGCILVAVQTLNQIVAIDPGTARVVGRYAPAGADHPHGMYVDAPNRLLFVANQGNATLQVVDLRTMEVTGTLKVGGDPDVLAFDPGSQRLYVATEEDGLWAYRVHGRKLFFEGRLDFPHAHTVSVDTGTHLVYLPLQSVDRRPMLRILSAAIVPNN